ncbi:hypothetical protein Dimus_011275 [Dionaea muscipula]
MYHPRGITVDDKGNIYIADTVNMAIRKVSDIGVTTIAGGKQSGGSHVDGPSEDAIFSDDFDLLYVGSSCSLLIIDRGYQAIREIQLSYDDCPSESFHYDDNFDFLGIAVLIAAGFFGYMLALLVQRVRALFSSDSEDPMGRELKSNTIAGTASYQRLPRPVIPPLIPNEEDETVKPEEGFLSSFARLVLNACSSAAELLGAILFWGFRKKQLDHQKLQHFHHHHLQQPRRQADTWPMQESYIIEDDIEPPFTSSTISPAPKSKPADSLMKNDLASKEQFRQQQMQQQHIQHQQWEQQQTLQQQEKKQQQQQQQREHPQRHGSSAPKAKCFEQNGAEASEIVFGAVQEQDGRREAVVIKAVDYSDPSNNHHNIRSRFNYMGYSSYGYS